jgi:uncharacterized protein involved in exopolysaccharide biosynthesis
LKAPTSGGGCLTEKNYRTYADRHEEARISEAMNKLKLSNISLIQAAVPRSKPIKPKKKMNLLLGGVVVMAVALVYVYLLENMEQTFSDPESIERFLELPVLLTVASKEVR